MAGVLMRRPRWGASAGPGSGGESSGVVSQKFVDEASRKPGGENMAVLRVGNAPCSWGTLEFEEAQAEQIPYGRMLDELAETGYTGTELGDWGYLPTDPDVLRSELSRRGLVMLAAFVPVALK